MESIVDSLHEVRISNKLIILLLWGDIISLLNDTRDVFPTQQRHCT